jgi:hypothetical protein
MQAVELEAAQLVRQFHAAPPRQQAHVATTLLEFCSRQPYGKEWHDASGRAGVVAAVAEAAKSSDVTLQQQAVAALGRLVFDHHDNQSAAAAAGAVPHLMQLTKSSNTALQQAAVMALGSLVFLHHDNQSAAAAAGAVPHLMQLTKSSNTALQEQAVSALGKLVYDHHGNQSAAAAAGSVPHLMQLTKSSNTALQEQAFMALARNAQVPSAPPPMPSSEPAFAAAASAAPAPVRLDAINCMDGDCPQTAVQMDKDFQDLCNIKFAASCSMFHIPNDVDRGHSSVK